MNTSRVFANIVCIFLIAFSAVLMAYFMATLKYQRLIIKRTDILEAALTVERQEDSVIKKKITEARKETVEKILSPVVIAEK